MLLIDIVLYGFLAAWLDNIIPTGTHIDIDIVLYSFLAAWFDNIIPTGTHIYIET